ncbi:hypothetical protein [Eudoraea sp.]|uniref:hypothetical protein n=1 Tax=Eudoraea sp. TaxID=1979955 RepID=UPI003C7489DA
MEYELITVDFFWYKRNIDYYDFKDQRKERTSSPDPSGFPTKNYSSFIVTLNCDTQYV